MSYDNCAYSWDWGWPGWPWVGAMLIAKRKKDGLQNEEMWERNGEKKSRTLTGGTSHSLKIESIWKVCFSATQMCINWPHHITGPSEWDRVSVRTRKKAEKPHERRRRLHLSFWHCNSQSSKLSSLESSICFCGLLSLIVCPTFFFFFDRK